MRRTPGQKCFAVVNGIVMTTVILLTLYPFYYVLAASVSDPDRVLQNQGLLLFPLGFSIKSYQFVLQNPSILFGFRNTLFYLLVGTAINMICTVLGAYALSRKKLLFKKPLMLFAVFTMFFSGGLIPLYLLMGPLQNTVWAVMLPAAINTWYLIIMRTSFLAVPDSLEESARIDGATDWTILLHVVLPLSAPVIIVMILFYGVERWNSWFWAMIFLRNRDLYPLQLVLRGILLDNDVNSMTSTVSNKDKFPIGVTIKYATIMVSAVPIMFIYPFLQKYFVKGIMIGALKG